MGQANRKTAQAPSEKMQTQGVAIKKEEETAQKREEKPWWAQSREWPERGPRHPNAPMSEPTQTLYPPCQTPDELLDEGRQRAWATLLRVKVTGRNREQAGFFISNDGFFVTMFTPKYAHFEVTGLFGTPLEVENVADNLDLRVSLLKVKGATRTPFLRPIPDTGYVMAPEEGCEHKSQWRLENPIGMYFRPYADCKAGCGWGAINWAAQLYVADKGVQGEPVLCLRSGYFVGLLWVRQKPGRSEFMLMTARSLLWPDFEQAMRRYRENAPAK